MDRFHLMQFIALVKKELIEHPNAFFIAPAALAGLILIVSAWVMSLVDAEIVSEGIAFLAMLFDGLSPLEMAPLFMILSLPFVVTYYCFAVLYLINSLYTDRNELSILFWQSMPVSNMKTVLSKIVTVGAAAPIAYIACLFVLYIVSVLWLTILGYSHDIEVSGLGYLLLASLVSLVFVYLSIVITSMWLLPTIGWMMLFSAFAKRTPLMWAFGVFVLANVLEDVIFGTQYLGNWVDSRANPGQYVVVDFADVVDRIFNYDMLFGLVIASILISGAVYMRRFID